MNHLQAHTNTESRPISMVLDSKLSSETAASFPGLKKDIDYFKRELNKANLAFWRSTKFLADTLVEARLTLSPDEFQEVIGEAQLDYSFVCKVLKQGADFRLNDPANDGILPEAFSTRHEIMLMKETTFRHGVSKGIIHANCTLADLKKFRAQMETPIRKSANPKTKVKGKASTATATAEVPKPMPTPVTPGAKETVPQVEKVVLNQPVNTLAVRTVENASTDERFAIGPGTATAKTVAAAKGRIAIVLPIEIVNQHKAAVDRLKEGIEALAKECDFISVVELEVAA